MDANTPLPDSPPICECGADLAYGQVVCHSCKQKYNEEEQS